MAQDLQTGRGFYYYFYVFYVLLKDAAAFQLALVHSGAGGRRLSATSSRLLRQAILLFCDSYQFWLFFHSFSQSGS